MTPESTQQAPGPSRALIAVITAALLVDMLVYGLVVPFLPQVCVERGAAGASIGLLVGCYALGLFVCAWPLARLVPRIGPRMAMAAGVLGLLLCTATFVAATSFAGLLAARTLQGVAAAATWTTGPMVLASLAAPEQRGRVMGFAIAGSGLGTLCGPPLGGFLFERGGLMLPFAVSMGLLALLLLAVLLIVPRQIAARQELPLRVVLGHPRVRLVAGIIAVAAAILTMLEPVLPLYLRDRFALDPSQIGLAFGAAILCYALAAGPAGALADRRGHTRIAALGLFASALLLPLLVLADSALGVVGVLGLLGAAGAFSLSPTMAAMANTLDGLDPTAQPDYASVYSIYNAAYAIGMWSGPVLGALLAEQLGLGPGLAIAAALSGLFGIKALRATSDRGALITLPK